MKVSEKNVILIMAMLLTFVALTTVKPVAAYTGTNLYADPAVIMRKDLHPGDTFTVDVRLENGTDVVTIACDLSWDPYYLNLTEITVGDALPGAALLIGYWDSPGGYIDDVTVGVLGTSYDVLNKTAFTANFTVMHPGSSVMDIFDMSCWDDTLLEFLSGDSPYDCTIHLSEVLTHTAVWDSVTYYVVTESNSTVANFTFSQPGYRVYFNVTGEDGTTGYTNITIPKNLLDVDPLQPPYDWVIAVNLVNITGPPTSTDNGTHSFVYANYTHSEHRIDVIGNVVVPEFPTVIMAFVILVATIIALVSVRKVYKPQGKRRYS